MQDNDVLQPQDNEQHTYILVTGANSGLGFGICCRLIDDFVSTRPSFQALTLILTTRGSTKGNDTIRRLKKYLEQRTKDERRTKELETSLEYRVFLQPEDLDLLSLRSVQRLATKLRGHLPHVDAVICNAGFGGFTGVNWPLAIWCNLTDPVQAVTYPTYKLASTGAITAPQTTLKDGEPQEPPLGQVFTSNVFGHYLLSHWLMPLLSSSPDHGRIIFISSIEPLAHHFTPTDIQALSSSKSYESSKRLTDLLALTSHLLSTQPFVTRFLTSTSPTPSRPISLLDNDPHSSGSSTPAQHIKLSDNEHAPARSTPTIYVAHPGICSTPILPLPYILQLLSILAMYLACLLGSPWHPIFAYKGAVAPVWLALTEKEELEEIELNGGKGKWGSACDRWGRERVMRTAVDGWGLGGRMGEGKLGGRRETRRGWVEVGGEEREAFEGVGRECWRVMEEMRRGWEGRLGVEGEGS